MNGEKDVNRRILIIDDNKSIHEDFRKILLAGDPRTSEFDEADEAIFGKDVSDIADVMPESFELDSAYQGQEGLALVEQAVENGRPYAMAFVDVRMPPGWDGIETIERIWQQAPDLQAVICTAFSDYSWREIIQKLGHSDNLLILKKPFDKVEVVQLAAALTEKWKLTRQARMTMDELERRVELQTRDITTTRDVALQALESVHNSWTHRQIETASRAMDRLDRSDQLAGTRPETAQSNGNAGQGQLTRRPYRTMATVFVPDPMLTEEPLFKAMCRTLGTGGMSFIHRSQVYEPEVIVFLQMKNGPMWFYGKVDGCEQISEGLWEHSVTFTRRSTATPIVAKQVVAAS